ncbi:MAG: Fe-S cluster assembly protein SufD [Bacteroidaceae bacterium]|nr:Fe-S cluster assembly protein SufD [Bacteroidaceae bacterium]
MSARQQYIDLFLQERQLIDRHSAPLMNALREKAYVDFQRQGFPTRKVEEYRYTDMEEVFAPDYGVNLQRVQFPVNPHDIFKCSVPNLSTSLYFMVNDLFHNSVMPKTQLPEGVVVGSLCQQALEHPELLQPYYGRLAKTEADSVTALNTMLAQDGLFIYIPKNVVVDKTIQVVNILRSDVDLMANRRVLIVLEQGAQAKVLFCDHAMDERSFLATQVCEVFVGENAHLELYDLEATHLQSRRVTNTYVRQQSYSTLNMCTITMHNGLTRNTLEVDLAGQYAETHVNGCVVADKQQHVDNNTLIRHSVPNCQSNELYKYVLDDSSVGAFAGKVLVVADAQKTVSNEVNANLCASPDARMYTQPMLEIYADDVKCSHGSTVGQLNEQALFYMRQRGISEAEARLLLKFAFVGEVIDSIKLETLRDRLHYLMEKRFRGELSHCEGCKVHN